MKEKRLLENVKIPFDFYLKEKNVLIECQGKQHYIWQKGL